MSPRSEWIGKQTILDNLQEAVLVVDSDFEIVYANNRLATMTGHSTDEICAMEWAEYAAFVEGNFESLRTAVDAVIQGSASEQRTDIEMTLPESAPLPTRIAAEARITQLASEDHETAALVVLRDITERNERERELYQFRNAVEFAGHAIFIADTNGTIEYVNPAFEEMTGYSATEAVGETPSLFHSGEHDEEFYEHVWNSIRRGETWTGEQIHERKSGERFVVNQTMAPIEDPDGEFQGIVAIQDEITDRQLREQQLKVFHRVLRHNLRNKGTAIKGNADLLERELPDDVPVDHLDVIRDNVESLLDVGEKAHYVRQVLADTLDEHAERDLPQVLERVADRVASSYPDAELSLEGDLSASLKTDANVVPALHELVENAVQHSDERRPRVTITVTGDDSIATVTIADNGPGMPDQERRVIEAGTEAPLEHGSGLGLWFAYWLLRYVGGDIEIEVDETGTAVIATMPVR